MFAEPEAGAGETKRGTARGAADARNDIMPYALVQGESLDAAATAFEGHPRFHMPQSSVGIPEVNPLHGMYGRFASRGTVRAQSGSIQLKAQTASLGDQYSTLWEPMDFCTICHTRVVDSQPLVEFGQQLAFGFVRPGRTAANRAPCGTRRCT